MPDSPNEHDFDWVSARLECCEANEFVRLRDLVEENCARRRKALPGDAAVDIKFVPVKGGQELFYVEVSPREGIAGNPRIVWFELKDCGICVRASQESRGLPATLTVRLNDAGECRFAIDGEGEHLRWQAACRALQSLFFPTG